MRRLKIYGFIILFLAGCGGDDQLPLPETLVVDGLIYAGQTVQVKVSLLAPLNSNTTLPYMDAPFIGVKSQGQDFPLWPQPEQPGVYYDPVNQIPLTPGEGILLFIPFQDTLVLSPTEIPFPPEDLRLDRVVIPLNASDLDTDNADTLRWQNSEERPFTAKLSLVNPNPVKIIPSESDPVNEFILDVINGDRYAIPHNALRYYGLYRVVLYAVNPEYAQFFASSQQSQIQQQTNIINGLGIFTAINSDTSYFFVVPR